MYALLGRYNYLGSILYGSFSEMPGKTGPPEKRSYYYGTEGVQYNDFGGGKSRVGIIIVSLT
jgi:hypothetical protein